MNQKSISNRLVLLTDLFVFASISYFISTTLYSVPFHVFLVQLFPALAILAVSFYLLSAFEITLEASLSSLVSRNILAVALAVIILLTIIYFLGPGSGKNVYGRGVFLLSVGVFTLYLIVTRIVRFRYLRKQNPFNEWCFFGSQDHYQLVKTEIDKTSRHRVRRSADSELFKVLESGSDLGLIIDDRLYSTYEVANRLVKERFSNRRITSIDLFYERYLEKIPLFHVKEFWFISNAGFEVVGDSVRQRIKRAGDVVLVLLSLPVTLPLGVLSSIAILLIDRVNPIFTQQRVGLHGRSFSIYKLKTMRPDHQKAGNWTTEDDDRITIVGKFLRRYRLDELPQLLNVLQGKMSVIGPRPEQPEYTSMLAEKIPFYDIRHNLKPGITGWAQVKYPYGASVEDSRAKLEYDLYYIKNYSVLLDLTILMKTIYTIISGTGR